MVKALIGDINLLVESVETKETNEIFVARNFIKNKTKDQYTWSDIQKFFEIEILLSVSIKKRRGWS